MPSADFVASSVEPKCAVVGLTGSPHRVSEGKPLLQQQHAPLVACPSGTVACLGASAGPGRGRTFDWVGELERRPRNHELDFLDLGAGGVLAGDLVRRVPDVIAMAPDKVIVWIGGNDVLASVSPKARWLFTRMRRPSLAPTPFGFHETLLSIVRRLKMGTEAQVAVCSLAPIGENPEPVTGFQLELNRRVAEYSAIVAHVARTERCAYIPVGEAIAARIADEPGRSYNRFDILPLYRNAFDARVLRKSSDEIGDRAGWRFHTDGLHLNDRAGHVVADLAQRFLEA
jgi:lysophospholipase L1-like esterase